MLVVPAQNYVKAASEAYDYLKSMRDAGVIQSAQGIMGETELMIFGNFIWELSYRYTDRDSEALNMLLGIAENMTEENPVRGMVLKCGLVVPDEQLVTLFCGRWCDQGYPRIVLEEKYAALLMATDANTEMVEEIIPPWKAFIISIPPGLLTTYCSMTKKQVNIARILVHAMVGENHELIWCFVAQGESGVQLWRHGLDLKNLVKVSPGDCSAWGEASFSVPVENHDERLLILIGRLIISVCYAMSNKDNFHEQKKSKGRGKKFRFNKIPEMKNYVLGKPISLDCRPVIKNFLNGEGRTGSAPKVQYFVRGHWRRVPYGPNSALRKVQHIHPYWKGPEEGAIVTKDIKIRG